MSIRQISRWLATLTWVMLLAATASAQPDVVYVPTPYDVVEKMLQMAGVDRNSVVYDLGCGDGRIVITAAKEYGARGVGVDIDPIRIRESRQNAARAGVTGRVQWVLGDLFQTDLRGATAVMLYLLPQMNLRLRSRLIEQLKPGTPIVSHDFDMGDWEPERTEYVDSAIRRHTVYRWTVPYQVGGIWLVTTQTAERLEMRLRQDEFRLTGKLVRQFAAGAAAPDDADQEFELRNARIVAGNQISFDYGEGRHFAGKTDGKILEGVVTGGAKPERWSAHKKALQGP